MAHQIPPGWTLEFMEQWVEARSKGIQHHPDPVLVKPSRTFLSKHIFLREDALVGCNIHDHSEWIRYR
jgi:hypothetical protein